MSIIELKFQVQGKEIPSDHGYWLYSALSRMIPELHEIENISICGISGLPDQFRTLHLNKSSKLRIRTENTNLPILLKLAGKQITLGDSKIRLGIPQAYMLKPHKTLYSRLVTIKGFLEPMEFKDSLKKKLVRLGINQEPILFQKDSSDYPIRKTVRIKDKEIVGYPVLIPNLSPDESILIQEQGLGGRRKMGCGSFVGVRG